ncbi:hypothetical protein IKD60_03275 [Candidatus Saccharibacteria bacterium]|nr:hypothetical protein [Candidatus Saccharibacteria bacterium]
MNKIKMLVAGAVMAAVAAVFSFVPAMAAVKCPEGSLRTGEAPTLAQCNVPEDSDESSPTNGKSLMEVVQTILNVIISVLGIVTVIMIILGGVQYMTSQGDPAKATKARNTILYGVIGLVVALLAFAIVNFVLDEVFKSDAVTKTEDTTQNTDNTSGKVEK